MSKKFAALIVAFVLAFALPAGTAFALNSPNLNSPNLNSPNLNSPNLNSPNLNSPNLNSPNLNSPNLNSPNLNSPNLDSPSLDSPALDAASATSNIQSNTIPGSAITGLDSASVQAGYALAPSAGALNLVTIACGTGLAIICAIGLGCALLYVVRKES